MIELHYKSDFKIDDRIFTAKDIKNLTQDEAAHFVLFLEKTKLDILDREFGVGDGGFEIVEDE